jgi:hypothetical protein
MMYSESGIRFLTICNRTGGFCTETLDCEKFKEKSWNGYTYIERCPHQEGRKINMPRRKKGYF